VSLILRLSDGDEGCMERDRCVYIGAAVELTVVPVYYNRLVKRFEISVGSFPGQIFRFGQIINCNCVI
jgi:hypothetical protein